MSWSNSSNRLPSTDPHGTPTVMPDAVAHEVHTVLWDIDGTLLTSRGVIGRLFLDAVSDVCEVRPESRGLDFGGRLDPEIAAMLVQAAGGRADHVAPVLERFESLVSAGRDTLAGHIRVLPGARELVGALHQAGVTQTVVTGNLETIGLFKLSAAGLVPPIDPAPGGFGASGHDRTAVAQAALDLLAADGRPHSPQTCWVIGDTPRDLACARALGLRCALVATGGHDLDSLSSLGADLVVADLGELQQRLGVGPR